MLNVRLYVKYVNHSICVMVGGNLEMNMM